MSTGTFKVGDNVRARVRRPDIPAGTTGVVVHVYRSLRGRYTVQFDTSTAPTFVWGYDLESAIAPTKPEPPPPVARDPWPRPGRTRR
jgi:hypothetical protein